MKHVCSWLGLAPHNDISGGKVLRLRTMEASSQLPDSVAAMRAWIERSAARGILSCRPAHAACRNACWPCGNRSSRAAARRRKARICERVSSRLMVMFDCAKSVQPGRRPILLARFRPYAS
ncbi:hypothetical protein [Kouleothrix sp.]|uniref:hypothetical protein n=1 Tax=Kouleothrix sp. TaxID=2779161 RepID=UPI00391D4D0F